MGKENGGFATLLAVSLLATLVALGLGVSSLYSELAAAEALLDRLESRFGESGEE